MADTTLELNSGSGGGKLAVDASGSTLYQYVKLTFGASGTQTPITGAAPLPVYLAGATSVTNTLVVTGSAGGAVVVDGSGVTQPISGDVTNAGTFAVQVDGAALTALQLIDDPVVADDAAFTPATTKVMMAGFEYDDTLPDSVDEGDAGAARMSANRNVYVQLRDAAGNERGLNIDASGQIAVTNAGTFATQVSSIPAVSLTGSAKTLLETIAGAVGGTEFQVDVITLPSLPAGTNNIGTVSLSGSTSVVIKATTNTIEVVGDVAHDAAVGGNPVLQGLEARTTNPTAVADGDAVRAMADDLGRQVITPYAPRDLVTQNHISLSVSTTQTLLAAGGAGVFSDLTMITVSNPSSTAATVTIFDGHTTGTQAFKWEFAADGGGITLVFPAPYKNGTANTGWGITSTETGVTATVQAINTV